MNKLWHITLLGSLQARQADREITRFQTQKTGELLGYLAYYRRRIHGRDTVMEALWPDVDPAQGRNRLKQAVASLRRQLEPAGTRANSVLVATRINLQLDPEAFSTDASDFEAALHQAHAETEASRQAEALMRAIGLFTGDLMAGYFSDWVLTERERLTQALQAALRRVINYWEAQADWERAIAYAQRLIAIEAFHEEAHRTLIRLYLKAREPGAALAQYRGLEQMLREALGIAPSDETQALIAHLQPGTIPTSLHRYRIRPHSRRASASSGAFRLLPAPLACWSSSAESPQPTIPGLSPPLTPLFGRDADIIRLEAIWRREANIRGDISRSRAATRGTNTTPSIRLVTLTGPGGSGKTRLAIAAAQRRQSVFGARMAFVALEAVAAASCLIEHIADSMGRDAAGSASGLSKIAAVVDGRPFLLILDNFEHLAEGAQEIRLLLEAAPTLVCLVTSRCQLDLDGEQVFPVEPLAIPSSLPSDFSSLLSFPSVQLFVNRAQAASPSFELSAHNANAVATLCSQLDGLPLAIELAAARVQMLTPAQIVARLPERFELLVNHKKGAPARHRSLEAAIATSVTALPERLQRLFTSLSIFRGGWTLEAAEEVCGAEGTLERLTQLRSQSLIVAEETHFGMRFRMLESLREYGDLHLDPDLRTHLSEAHAAYFLGLCERAVTSAQTAAQAIRQEQLKQDHDNCLAALAWYQPQPGKEYTALRIVGTW